MFNRSKSLSENEEEEEHIDSEASLLHKKIMLKELKQRGGVGFWKRFSPDGTKQGVNFRSVWQWLKTH